MTLAADAGTFTTLVAAVEAAGLAPVPQGEGPFTVFAPTDEAFAKLPAGTLDALFADTERLRAILTYYVVPGRAMAGDIVRSGGAQPRTVQGESLTIQVQGGSVLVDGATVTAPDVEASNGVIHVIDSVVLPDAASRTGFSAGPGRGESSSRPVYSSLSAYPSSTSFDNEAAAGHHPCPLSSSSASSSAITSRSFGRPAALLARINARSPRAL